MIIYKTDRKFLIPIAFSKILTYFRPGFIHPFDGEIYLHLSGTH